MTLVNLILSHIDPATLGWKALAVLVLAIGWNTFATWFNSLDLEVYDPEWMDADAWKEAYR